MRAYAGQLAKRLPVVYVKADELGTTADILPLLYRAGVSELRLVDPCDDWLLRRLKKGLKDGFGRTSDRDQLIRLVLLEDPHFLTPLSVFEEFSTDRKKWFFTDFYIQQRQRLGILLDDQRRPLGGKWSYDVANRKRLPKGVSPPAILWPKSRKETRAAIESVADEFPSAQGIASEFRYPITTGDARQGLADFLKERFAQFGDYEDAIQDDEAFLFHSVLTPALNCGLLSPAEVLEGALSYADRVPLNSLEGFVRQVIGWREYMRGVYLNFGRRQRTTNFWNHHRPLPKSMYLAKTGIEPVDVVIERVRKYAYCHHIERLMILGNFMLLCEIDPRAIYQWFMELFIDAYDWVMVPNVYGMSQYADGGLITTKPYLSGSAYVLKMSNFKRGPWCAIWDALYWRFIDRHREFFAKNARMSVMVSQCDRLGKRLTDHHRTAESFLNSL